jgi:hypothetical protein
MQFQLPANLRQQVAAYDPAMKALLAAQKAENAAAKKKSTTPLGVPDDLFPVEVMDKESQIKTVKSINLKPAPERFALIQSGDYHCLIYHHEKIWLAAWHLQNCESLLDESVPYIYGLSVAYKAAPSTADKISKVVTGSYSDVFNTPDKMTEVKYGRTLFLKRTHLFTLEDIQNHHSQPGWMSLLNSWSKASRLKNAPAKTFSNSISSKIPCWKDQGIFNRVKDKDKSVAALLRSYYSNTVPPAGDVTAEWLSGTAGSVTSSKVFNTPYFRRDLQKTVEKINAVYHDRNETSSDKIKEPHQLWRQKMSMADQLVSVYGADIPVDYVQKMYEIGANVEGWTVPRYVATWLKANVPIASFVGWHERYYNELHKEWAANPDERMRRTRFNSTGEPSGYFGELRDTYNMMQELWRHQTNGMDYEAREDHALQLETPSRWRLTEFHDHVSSKVWLLANRNENLPQDLFPTPVKVNHGDSRWTFFQPVDVHQLGQWGNAVRNCVGNASNYRDGIKKRSHFIVLAMIDQKPRFTVQLRVRNGVMEVDQIADVGNKRLNDEDRSAYQLLFSEALKIRERQLAPVQQDAV